MTMLKTTVHSLLPHGDPMILLDSIESCFENGLTAILHIRDDLLFATDEGVPAWVGLEYMGQAIAAFAGVNARQNNEPVRIGFLVSCRRYEPLVSYFSLGMSLTIRVEAVTFNTTGLRVFECSISAGKQCLVTANLNVYMPEDAGTFIRESN